MMTKIPIGKANWAKKFCLLYLIGILSLIDTTVNLLEIFLKIIPEILIIFLPCNLEYFQKREGNI